MFVFNEKAVFCYLSPYFLNIIQKIDLTEHALLSYLAD